MPSRGFSMPRGRSSGAMSTQRHTATVSGVESRRARSPRRGTLADRARSHRGHDGHLRGVHPARRLRQGVPRHDHRAGTERRHRARRPGDPLGLGAHPRSTCAGPTRTTTTAWPRFATGGCDERRHGTTQPDRDGRLLRVHRGVARHHLCGGAAHEEHRRLLRRRPLGDRAAERPGAGRRLHERGELSRHRRAGGAVGLRRPDLLDRLPRRLARGAVPHRRAAAQPRDATRSRTSWPSACSSGRCAWPRPSAAWP